MYLMDTATRNREVKLKRLACGLRTENGDSTWMCTEKTFGFGMERYARSFAETRKSTRSVGKGPTKRECIGYGG